MEPSNSKVQRVAGQRNVVIKHQDDGVAPPHEALNLIVVAADGELIRVDGPGGSRRASASTCQVHRIKERLMKSPTGSGDGHEVLFARPLLLRQSVADDEPLLHAMK